MKTSLEITKYFYKILNVTELTSLIDGNIYRINKPKDSEWQDIVINSLFLNPIDVNELQNGSININCYCKNIQGVADIINLEKISNKVIELLLAYEQKTSLLNYTIEDTNAITDLAQNTMTYLNIKINIHIN